MVFIRGKLASPSHANKDLIQAEKLKMDIKHFFSFYLYITFVSITLLSKFCLSCCFFFIRYCIFCTYTPFFLHFEGFPRKIRYFCQFPPHIYSENRCYSWLKLILCINKKFLKYPDISTWQIKEKEMQIIRVRLIGKSGS